MRKTIAGACGVLLVSAGWMIVSAQTPAASSGVKITPVTIEETRRKILSGRPIGGVPAGLKLAVNVTGPAAAAAVRYGHVIVNEAVDDQGNRLEKVRLILERRQREGFLPIDAWKRGNVKDGFQIDLYLAQSKRPATKIVRLSGSLKLLTGGKPTRVVVKNVSALAGKEVSSKTLAAEGVKMTIATNSSGSGEGARQVSYTLGGNAAAVLEASLVDAGGTPIPSMPGYSTGCGGAKVHFLKALKPLPKGAGVKLSVLTDAKVTLVPLSLKDIPLP